MMRWIAFFSIFWTCLLAGCVGYVKFGPGAAVPVTQPADRPTCTIFLLPVQEGPGAIPTITPTMDHDTVIDLLGLEIMRLRQVVLDNQDRLQTHHRQYMSQCDPSVFLHTYD